MTRPRTSIARMSALFIPREGIEYLPGSEGCVMRTRLFVVISSVFLSTVLCNEANAQTQRQRHLPYIRAASDCIANAVKRDYAFADAVETDNFKPLIGRAYDPCRSELVKMMQAHDEIFGGGGAQFLTVDYAADVERAVKTRLAGAIEETRSNLARAAEQRALADAKAKADRIEAENRAKAAQAEKLAVTKQAQDLIRERMFNCIGKEAATMILTNETAEVVAKAAMVFCRSEVDAMAQVTMDVIEAEAGEVRSKSAFRQQADTTVKDFVTAYIVKARGAMLSSKGRRGNNEPATSEQGTTF